MLSYVVLYVNKNNGNVLVQRCGRHSIGAITEIGDPILIQNSELQSRLAAEVMCALNTFDPNPQDDAVLKRRTRVEQRNFLRTYNQVSVTRMDDGGFEVHPLRHERGGYVSIDSEKQTLDSTAGEGELHSAIVRALSKAE